MFAPIDDIEITFDDGLDDPFSFADGGTRSDIDDSYDSYDDAYESYEPYADEDSDRIVIVDDALKDRQRSTRSSRSSPLPPIGNYRERTPRKGASPLGIGLGIAAMVLLLMLLASRCGGGKTTQTTGTTTTVTPAAVTGATSPVVTAPTVTGGGVAATVAPPTTAPLGARTPATYVLYFASGSTAIDAAGSEQIRLAVARIKELGATTVTIPVVGYTDSSGNPATNLALGLARATAVSDQLKAAVPGLKTSVSSLGDTNPDADPAKSRRVHITVP